MSVNNQRQALTRERGLPPGANQSQELVAITPYDRCRSFTIATIIQHSAENLHENSHHEGHIVPGKGGLSHGTPRFSFSFVRIQFATFFVNFYQANQFCSTRPPALRHDMLRPWQADLSRSCFSPHKKNRKCAKKVARSVEPICW